MKPLTDINEIKSCIHIKIADHDYGQCTVEIPELRVLLDSHDTQLADIDRLLDRLEPLWAVWNEATEKQRELIGDSIKLAHQTHTELREKYPKEPQPND